MARSITVTPGTLVNYEGLGIAVNANYNDPEYGSQPYVTVSTDALDPAHSYDEKSGLRGSDTPYSVGRDSDTDEYLVWGPDAEGKLVPVARFPIVTTRHDASKGATIHAESLNGTWAKRNCGMPAIAVHLNDAALFDDAGQGNTAPIIDTPTVYVVVPTTSDDEPAVFAHLEDAEAYSATFSGDPGYSALIVCDRKTAAKMIAERREGEGPVKIALTDQDMEDLDDGNTINAMAEDGSEITLALNDGEARTLRAGDSIEREAFLPDRGEDVSYTITYEAPEPSDDQLANGFGIEGGIGYDTTPDTRDEHDETL